MNVLDVCGKKSAIAQGLKKPVTFGSACSLLGQRIYLMVDDRCALGFIKVGTKRLYVAPPALHASRSNNTCVQDALKEINPVCVLDFYVHESCQRTGYGKMLFDTMLEDEGLSAAQLAYDRPSGKFLPFLAKHCGLKRYQPQNNNFVIFDEYFNQGRSSAVASGRGSRSCDSGAGSVRRGRSGEGMSELGYGNSRTSGILPGMLGAETPSSRSTGNRMQSSLPRPPLIPSPAAYGSTPTSAAPSHMGSRAMDVDMSVGNGASASLSMGHSRPPSLPSNSRPPLGVAPSMQQAASGPSLQTPWGTLSDVPAKHGRYGRGPYPAPEGSCAGMPSGGIGRSVSLPCKENRGQVRNSGESPLTGYGEGSVASSSRRYASPLSHAGQRMLAH